MIRRRSRLRIYFSVRRRRTSNILPAGITACGARAWRLIEITGYVASIYIQVLTISRTVIQVAAKRCDVAIDDCAIDVDVREVSVHVGVVDVNVSSVHIDPTNANPPVVIDSRTIPMPIAIQPRTNCESDPESNGH